MTRLRLNITMSLDGYVAGPRQSVSNPLGEGGQELHNWAFAVRSFRERHGMEGGTTGPDDQIAAESLQNIGATIMGRHMFGGGDGPWSDNPRWNGWWGKNPPFHTPVFVLTHHAREPLEMEGGTTFYFVTEGIHAALDQAKAAAGGKDVALGGNAGIVRLMPEAVSVVLRCGSRTDASVAALRPLERQAGTPMCLATSSTCSTREFVYPNSLSYQL